MQEKLCICHQYGKGCSVIKGFIDGKDHCYTMRLQTPPQDTLGGEILSPASPSSTKEGGSVLGTSLCQALPSGAVQNLEREQATGGMLLQSRGDEIPPSPNDPVAPCNSNNRACPPLPNIQLSLSPAASSANKLQTWTPAIPWPLKRTTLTEPRTSSSQSFSCKEEWGVSLIREQCR